MMTDIATSAGERTAFVIALDGDIDMARIPELHAAVEAYGASTAVDIVVDLTEVDFMDSTGLGTMTRLRSEAKARGGVITIRNPNPQVSRAISIAGLGQVLNLQDD